MTAPRMLQNTVPEGPGYVDIWLRFDTHYGAKECDLAMLQRYTEWLAGGRNRYDIWGGDIGEFAIPTQEKFKYLPGQSEPPDKQWDYFTAELKHKPLVVILGNHEYGRIIKSSHFFDPIEKECTALGVPYSIVNTYFLLRTGSMEYLFYLSHGRSGAMRDDYITQLLVEKGIADAADFVIVGHTHHNNSRKFYRNSVDRTTGEVKAREIFGIRPGSFLSAPEYISMDKPRPVLPGNVILRLYTNFRGCEIYTNLDEWELKNDVVATEKTVG